jgi:transposase
VIITAAQILADLGEADSKPTWDGTQEEFADRYRQLADAGLTCPEMAERIGLTVIALKSRVRRARRHGLIPPAGPNRGRRRRSDA